MNQVGMNIVPSRDIGNARAVSRALLHDPQLLADAPTSPSLGTTKHRDRCHVASLIAHQ